MPARLPVLLLALVLVACSSSYVPPPLVVATPDELTAAVAPLTAGVEGGILIGAGDIARSSEFPNAKATGDIIRAVLATKPDAMVFTAGDNAYQDGTVSNFQMYYEPAWGSFNGSTVPVPGNHDYRTPGARPYFDYFDYYRANPDARTRTYYSFDLEGWHIVSLNSNIAMGARSAQVAWLDNDLANTSKRCILAIWHHPRFSSGRQGAQALDEGRRTGALWDTLLRYKADVIVNGHDHTYERFARQDTRGTPSASGIRQFVVGTGGAVLREFKSTKPNSEVRDNAHNGVLLLTLRPDSYEWAFIATDGVIYDRSAAPEACHD